MNNKAVAGAAITALVAFLGWVGITLHEISIDHERLETRVYVWHVDELPPSNGQNIEALYMLTNKGEPNCDCQKAAFQHKSIQAAIRFIDNDEIEMARDVLAEALVY